MSRLMVPYTHRTLWATGDVLLSAYLRLQIKTRLGNWVTRAFRADSGSEISTMPAFLAKQLGLPMPPRAAPRVQHHPTGLSVRSGLLRARIVGMDATVYG